MIVVLAYSHEINLDIVNDTNLLFIQQNILDWFLLSLIPIVSQLSVVPGVSHHEAVLLSAIVVGVDHAGKVSGI